MKERVPRRRTSRWKWVLLAVLLGVLVIYGTVFKRSGKTVYPESAFYEVKRSDLLISIVEEGALRALNETIVQNGLEGVNRIIHLAPEGIQVKKGDLLVELDSAGLRDRINEQELQYQDRLFYFLQATANLKIQKSQADSSIKDAELKVENALTDFEKYRDGDAPLLLKTVETRSGVLSEQVRIAKERAVRTAELFKMGNATRSEMEADALVLTREQLGLQQYQEDLRLIKKFDIPKELRSYESKYIQAKEELERLRQRTSNEIAQAEADLRTSERSVNFLKESLVTLKSRLEAAKIYAPQDGLVVYASVSPFQSMEVRRDEGRFRGGEGRGGGGPGGGGGGRFGGGGEGRGREGRGGGGNEERTGGSAVTGGTASSSTTRLAATANSSGGGAAAGANSAGPSVMAGNSPGTGSSSGGGGGGSSGGGRGGASGGSGVSSASSAFVSYPSMRPASVIGGGANNANTTAGGTSGGTGSGTSPGSSSGSSDTSMSSGGFGSQNSQLNNRFGNRGGFNDYEFMSGTPGVLEEGLMVRQRQELIRLPDVSKMLAEIRIPEERVAQIRTGMKALIRIDNVPNRTFKGTVRRVALMPDAQMAWLNPDKKVFPADILVEDELPYLKPGVSARAEVMITNLTKVLSVPIQTVARLRGQNVCFVKRGSDVVPVPVVIGLYNEEFMEIKSGLKEGDRVLLAPKGDEDFPAEEGSTNKVDGASAETPPPAEVIEAAPTEERRMQRPSRDFGGGSTNGPGSGEGRRRRSDFGGESPATPEGGSGFERPRRGEGAPGEGRINRRPEGSEGGAAGEQPQRRRNRQGGPPREGRPNTEEPPQ